ncbi:tetratricopeptide repeat protein [Corynebacterium sp. TAE3-ERU12]|uniref:tetratricopeptide repeat protein n=1 Tax=Corynebacterium sp. TAE3-ERU12 TaxID=2849491 RepID=UPI001C49016C|nr:tetratricopeptide repeat protein [Corynebacterium sp. TAE3-ERU12]
MAEHDGRRSGGRSHGKPDNFGGARGGRGRDERRGRSGNRDDRRGRGDERRHAQRGGRDRDRNNPSGPQRPGFREERMNLRANEPDLPDDVRADELDPSVRQDLRSLAKDNADAVARHMVMAATLLIDDPQQALRHARAAKDRAGRVGVVRETNGVVAYHAGEWKEALSELRAARRMSGGPGMIAVMADCERGLGRPEKAIELAHSEDLSGLTDEDRTELAIVVAGARRDLGDVEAAILELEMQDLDPSRKDLEAARLFYAYADNLAAADRVSEARTWFERIVDMDPDDALGAKQRLKELPEG